MENSLMAPTTEQSKIKQARLSMLSSVNLFPSSDLHSAFPPEQNTFGNPLGPTSCRSTKNKKPNQNPTANKSEHNYKEFSIWGMDAFFTPRFAHVIDTPCCLSLA